MKKPAQIVTLLESIQESRNVHDLDEARWISRFARDNKGFIQLEANDDPSPNSPYFKAKLTGMGRTYLSTYRWEHSSELSRTPQASR